LVTCWTFTAKAKAISHLGNLSHLTSQIPGIDLTILPFKVINVSFHVQMSIQTQQAQA